METMIPLRIEADRIINLLAKQIYQSPLALLRENTQNAFDAIRLKLVHDKSFSPRISVNIQSDRIVIEDNGIGMTADDLENHYWKAGSSSKNNEEAKKAGVVGTFGIGAMANFGVSSTIIVETESFSAGVRMYNSAEKSKLSFNNNCILNKEIPATGCSGTVVTAILEHGVAISQEQATSYLKEFVSLAPIPILVNGHNISQQDIQTLVPKIAVTKKFGSKNIKIGSRLSASVDFSVSVNADIALVLQDISWNGVPIQGKIALRSGVSSIKTFRGGFGLASMSVSSAYQFGGAVDLMTLEPTAGREALTTECVQMLQAMFTEIDSYVSMELSKLEECDASTPFINWVNRHGRHDLCGLLRINIQPGDQRVTLAEVAERTKVAVMNFYDGSDPGVIKLHASDETPLLVLARGNPRKLCESSYLSKFCRVKKTSSAPKVQSRKKFSEYSKAEKALSFKLENILESDYFISVTIDFGLISYGIPIFVERESSKLNIVLNTEGGTLNTLLSVYDTEWNSFNSLVKDFVRTVIFPQIANDVPSSTKQGAEAFLNSIRRKREVFEYDLDDLSPLSKIWEDYEEGRLTVEEAVERSKNYVRNSVQILDKQVTGNASEILSDIIQNDITMQSAEQPENNSDVGDAMEASPAFTRLEVSTPSKLLIVSPNESALRGYRCFLALTDKVREEMGDFFLQPHRTSIVWGGQKILFIFLHHSETFGVYYDLQMAESVGIEAGGRIYPTATIILKDKIFIPIPEEIAESFLPSEGEKKRFEIRADILKTDIR